MRVLILTQGQHTVVDDHVYEWARKFEWHAIKAARQWYAARAFRNALGKVVQVLLHREILGTPKGIFTDHIDGDGLNNLTDNLRVCSNTQNQHNSQVPVTNTSGLKGVFFYSAIQKWRAQIKRGGRSVRLGDFSTADEAACAYDIAAIERDGAFARINFPEKTKL